METPPSSRWRKALEARFYEALLHFPERIDLMETRSEASCRALAAQLVAIASRELENGEPRVGQEDL